jgi:hypothetical protein
VYSFQMPPDPICFSAARDRCVQMAWKPPTAPLKNKRSGEFRCYKQATR